MFAIAGVILIIIASQIGVPPELELDYVHEGQACMVVGAACLAWSVLNLVKGLSAALPLLLAILGVAICGTAFYQRDVIVLTVGAVLLAVWAWTMWRNRKPKKSKSKKSKA